MRMVEEECWMGKKGREADAKIREDRRSGERKKKH